MAELHRPALAVGVMGSASPPIPPGAFTAARQLGRAVARHGCTLMTGACPGLPYAAVEGAKEAGGLVVGISPALAEAEHTRLFHSPVRGFDVVIYTGSGLMGREVVNIRSSDMVVIISGHSGTLGEFAIAYDEGRLIGVLTGTGGVADMAMALEAQLGGKRTGAKVLYDDDPDRLVERLVDYYTSSHVRRPHVFAGLLNDGAPHAGAFAPGNGTVPSERLQPVTGDSAGQEQPEATMRAAVGDRIVVRSLHVGEPARDAEILEVHGKDGAPPYVVRWSDDGHVGLYFPGPDAQINPAVEVVGEM